MPICTYQDRFMLNACTHILCGFIKNIDRFIFTLENTFVLCYFDQIHYCSKVHTKAVYIYEFNGSHDYWAIRRENCDDGMRRLKDTSTPGQTWESKHKHFDLVAIFQHLFLVMCRF